MHFHIKSMLKSFTGECSMYSYRFDCRGQVHNDSHFEHLEIQVESLRSSSQKSSPQLNMVCLEAGTPLSIGLIIIYNLMLVMYYYIILYYIILYYIILYYIILYYIVLYYIILQYIILYYIVLYYIILQYIILYYIILYYCILYYIVLYYIILYYNVI